eukprot:gene1207-11297_t
MRLKFTILICFLFIFFVKGNNVLNLNVLNNGSTNSTRTFPAPWFGTSFFSISMYIVFAIASLIIMSLIMCVAFCVVKITEIRPKLGNEKHSVVTGSNIDQDYTSVPSNDTHNNDSSYSVLPND